MSLGPLQPHLAVTLGIVAPLLADLDEQEQVNGRLEDLDQLLAGLGTDRLDGLTTSAQNDLLVRIAGDVDYLVDAIGAVLLDGELLSLDRGVVGDFFVNAEKQFLARHLRGGDRQCQVGELILGEMPGPERDTLAGPVEEILDAVAAQSREHEGRLERNAFVDRLRIAIVDSPPIDASKGGYIAEGYDAALDALREAASNGRRAIAALEARCRDSTGISSLKIRHNAVLGYHVEVSAKHADRLMAPDSGFTHRQTLAGVVRFNSPELHEEASRVVEAGAHALAAEAAHAEELTTLAVAAAPQITATAEAIARIDVAAGNAHRAAEDGWTLPHLADEPCLEIEAGRHPVVEGALRETGERFIANDLALGRGDRLWLITGPNMGGKSTFLRQAALIALLAQAGCFVPAARAKIGIVDRLFSRVGASDNLARGRSTFMVEMVETAAILAQATPSSLVILDEIGRGTSTYDGLAIAWAVVEAMHDQVKCRTLFATHYHELTRLSGRLDSLSLHHVRAREWKGDLLLLHEVADGAADRSYGIAVAKLAGLPPAVVARARSVLAKLEAGRDATGGIAAGLDDLPLFAASVEPERGPDPLAAALDEIDPDALSPREALEHLYRLKRLASEQG